MAKKLTRRQVFKLSLAGIAIPPLSYIFSVSIGGYVPFAGLRHLTSKEARIVEALGETIVTGSALGVSIQDAELVKGVDELMSISPAHTVSRMRLGFWTVEHILPGFSFNFSKFTKLMPEQRLAILNKFEKSKE